MSPIHAAIPCEKCRHPQTEIVAARVYLSANEQGERIHQQTIYTLRCANQDCRHCFKTIVPPERELL